MSHRRAAKVDTNQAAIVKDLRKIGATVDFWGTDGAPDLVVGFRGKAYFMETKRPEKKGWASEFTPAQIKFRDSWNGPEIHTIYTPEQAIEAIT